jgi:AAA15 family ATPase/GTPase
MISEIKFGNFRVFKGESCISFVPDGRTKLMMSNSIALDNRNILKAIAIYGSNNSGKTNIVKIFSIIKKVLHGEDDFVCNREIFGDSPVSSFSITFNNCDEKGWYKYEFSFNSETGRFIKEKLSSISYYEKGKPLEKVVFEKDNETKVFTVEGTDFSDTLDYIPSKRSILYSVETSSGRFLALNKYLESFDTLYKSIEIVKMYNIPIKKTIQDLKGDDLKRKKFIASFVRDADISINDFKYEENLTFGNEGTKVEEKALNEVAQNQDVFHLSTTYKNTSVPSLFFDSSGTKKMEAFASYMYDALVEGKTLIVDELDNGLHFRLTRAIVSAFNNMINKRGQILFTAHDLMLIDCKMLLRKEQIYFTSRNPETSTLLCLRDLTVAEGGPREGSDLLKRYNSGDLTPLPTPSFVKELISLNQGAK